MDWCTLECRKIVLHRSVGCLFERQFDRPRELVNVHVDIFMAHCMACDSPSNSILTLDLTLRPDQRGTHLSIPVRPPTSNLRAHELCLEGDVVRANMGLTQSFPNEL